MKSITIMAIAALATALSACQKENISETIPSGYMRASGECSIDSIGDGKIYILVETGDGFQHVAAEIYGYEENYYEEADDAVIDSLRAGHALQGAFYEDKNFDPQVEKNNFVKVADAQPVIFL